MKLLYKIAVYPGFRLTHLAMSQVLRKAVRTQALFGGIQALKKKLFPAFVGFGCQINVDALGRSVLAESRTER